jgi:hypothetical protein
MVLGSLLPDLLDKALKLAHVYPWGRTVGHSAILWAVMPTLTLLLIGRWVWTRRATWRSAPLPPAIAILVGICLGGGLHMAGDLLADVERGWVFRGVAVSWWFGWPWMNPDQVIFACGPARHLPSLPSVLEVLVVAWTAGRVLRHWRLTSSQPPIA